VSEEPRVRPAPPSHLAQVDETATSFKESDPFGPRDP